MKELSIFIDESGDFGRYDHISPYYIIGIVLHDQKDDISTQVTALDHSISETKLKRNLVHVGPLVRREKEYKYLSVQERRSVLRRLMTFAKKTNFLCNAIVVNKKDISTSVELTARLTKQLSEFIKENLGYFEKYDHIKIYYDNGQSGIVKIIVAVFNALFSCVEFKDATQEKYKMLQVADLVCSAKLIELKMLDKTLSKSERNVLGNDRYIKQNLLKPLKKKKFTC